MRYRSTRVAIVASFAFLNLWVATSLLRSYAFATADPRLYSALSSEAWTLDLPAMGFVGLLIMGMAQHFVPLFSRRNLRSERAGVVQVGMGIAAVGLLLLSPATETAGKALWFAASFFFVVLILATLRSPPRDDRGPEPKPGLRAVDRWAIPMTAAAILYLVAASFGFLLASPAGDPLVPGIARFWFSFFHLYTLGFIALMIFGVGFHLFPRFLDAVPRLAGVKIVTVLAIPGPIGVALTMPFPSGSGPTALLSSLFAVVEATAAILFAILVVDTWRRSSKRRPASYLTLAGSLWLILGVSLGALFGIAPGSYLGWIPVHGWVNLLGFAGFEIFGVTHEILPPFTPKGLRAVRSTTFADLTLAAVGLGLVVSSYAAGLAGVASQANALAIAGFSLLLTMTVLYTAGTLHTLRAIIPPRRRK